MTKIWLMGSSSCDMHESPFILPMCTRSSSPPVDMLLVSGNLKVSSEE